MSTRSANATIKGYFYQFDHSIVQLLGAANKSATVVVEGIEDVDLVDGTEDVLIQCKYYEGTEYNHSLIKDAVIQMLRHFSNGGCDSSQTLRYKVYGHYKSGQGKLPSSFDIEFLKTHFLTFTSKKNIHKVYDELAVDDAQLATFIKLLEIDVRAKTYDEQQHEVTRMLVSQIPGCNIEDAKTFYYPLAIHAIQNIAVQKDESNRKITKGQFLTAIKKKDIVFAAWLRKKFGDDYYARSIKRRYFHFGATKVPKESRIFILDAADEFDVAKMVALLANIGKKFSHVEHIRTPATDRFCPYVLIQSVSAEELIALKTQLFNSGIKINDGYAFNGAPFSPRELALAPTKDKLIKLKFIPSPERIEAVITELVGTIVTIFEFYKEVPIAEALAPSNVLHHKFKIETVHFINEAI